MSNLGWVKVNLKLDLKLVNLPIRLKISGKNIMQGKYNVYLVVCLVKFIYSEKATKFCEIFPLLLTTVNTVKSKGKFRKIFI